MKPEEKDIEQREIFTPDSLSIREEDKGKVIEGVAIVIDKETVLYEGSDYREVEVISKSCIDPQFVREQDIKLNLLHNRYDTIARTPKSLRVESREDGLYFEAEIPQCDLGKRAQELIANGTYTGCSFEFRAKDYETSERKGLDGKTEYVVKHTSFKKIEAVTIAMDPAYKATKVSVRELYQQQHPDNHEAEEVEAAKREAEEAAKAAKEAENMKQREMDEQRRRSCLRHMTTKNFNY